MTTPPSPGSGRSRDYSRVQLDDAQIDAGAYKNFLGGRGEGWEARGAFQLELLRHLGLQPEHSLLDIGCGPIRGGVHFIRYLDAGGYRGVDYNPSFIEAARRLIEAGADLDAKRPEVSLLADFDFATLGRSFDRLLCFSVLNHCDATARERFFERVPTVMHAGSRLLVTHAAWFEDSMLRDVPLAVVGRIETEDQLPTALALVDWGFDGVRDRLPMVEFARR